MGIDPGVSRLGGEIISHNTTDARREEWKIGCLVSYAIGKQPSMPLNNLGRKWTLRR